jgi:hypothetical protein
MATKFAEFIESNKLDPRRILVASRQLERLTREDRARDAARAKRGKGKKADAPAAEGEKAEAPTKGHSGKPVTPPLLGRALAGKPVSGAAKTRLLRAVNRMLERKKVDPVDIRKLF